MRSPRSGDSWSLPPPPFVYIDNRSLDGFIDHFKKNRCYGQCGVGCNYCEEIAKKVIRIDKTEVREYVNKLLEIIQKWKEGFK